jgi:hypothetical protein
MPPLRGLTQRRFERINRTHAAGRAGQLIAEGRLFGFPL